MREQIIPRGRVDDCPDGDRVDIVCTLLYMVAGLSIMENVQFLWKHLYTIPVVSVTLYFGLKEINTAQKHTFSSPGNQLVFIGNY